MIRTVARAIQQHERSRQKNEFFNEAIAKGITVMKVPKTESRGDRIFPVAIWEGYALALSAHVCDVILDAGVTGFWISHEK